MKFYIFRHGETFESKHDIPYADNIEKAEILPERIPIVKKLANYIKSKEIDAYYSSTYLRCKQTSTIISEITEKDFVYDENLGEFRRERETIEIFISRVKSFFDKLKLKDYQSIAICTHGYVVAALRELITQGYVQEERLNDYPRTGVIVQAEDGKINSIDFNK